VIESRNDHNSDYDRLDDYPNLVKIKGVKSFTAFTEKNRQGNIFPGIESKAVSANVLAYYGSIGTSVDLC